MWLFAVALILLVCLLVFGQEDGGSYEDEEDLEFLEEEVLFLFDEDEEDQ